jgi:hypothetical protein
MLGEDVIRVACLGTASQIGIKAPLPLVSPEPVDIRISRFFGNGFRACVHGNSYATFAGSSTSSAWYAASIFGVSPFFASSSANSVRISGFSST